MKDVNCGVKVIFGMGSIVAWGKQKRKGKFESQQVAA